MIEAVARALWNEVNRAELIAPTDWRDVPDRVRKETLTVARAARDAVLAELREPSQEMVEAMRLELDRLVNVEEGTPISFEAVARSVWQAGLDAALSGEVTGG